jgi:hypothetical protein
MKLDDKLETILNSKEPLCEELVRHVVQTKLGPWVNHPLVHEMIFCPALLNAQLKHKREAVAEYIAEGKFSSALFMHEKPYRLTTLFRWRFGLEQTVPDEQFLECLREAWIASENIWQNLLLVPILFKEARRLGGMPLEDDEKDALRGMPNLVTVYRGCTRKNRRGWSWTTDLKTARFFAKRFTTKGGMVIKALAPKIEIEAYLHGRGEAEVVINPKAIDWKKATTI